MGMDAVRYPQQERRPAVYWRRRFLTLVVGLAVLSLIAWAFSGALGGAGGRAAGPAAGNGGTRIGQAAGRPGPGAGGSGPGAATARPAQSPGSAARGGPGQGPDLAGTRPPASSRGQSAGGPGGHGPGGQHGEKHGSKLRGCRHRGIVLSLSASQDNFGSRELPMFDVYVVSTSGTACRFNVGAKHVRLVIRSGPERIWGSADCLAGAGSLSTDLERGVPTVLPISWDRKTSSAGCQVTSSRVPAGTYAATAVDGTVTSNTETFRLG
jgi:hypothetical protein